MQHDAVRILISLGRAITVGWLWSLQCKRQRCEFHALSSTCFMCVTEVFL